MKKKIYFFIGTTAEFIKLAPIVREFKKRGISFKIITSGQTKVLFGDLRGYVGDMKVDIAFKKKGKKSSVFLFGLWAIRTFFVALFSLRREFKGLNKKNSYFIVHGDTVSSLIGAVIASIYRLKLVHIESGLRSFNFLEPFPEEICRYLIIHLADILFAPNNWAMGNLHNLHGIKVNTRQNTLIESFWWAVRTRGHAAFIEKFKKYYILIMHRQEHVLFRQKWTKNTLEFVIRNAKKDLDCIFIMHHLSTKFFQGLNKQIKKRVVVIPRLPYTKFMKLMNNAEFIATDGCTNQEEAYYMGLPLLALRNLTERPEGLGKNIVLAKNKMSVMEDFLENYKKYKKKKFLLGKNSPAKTIVDYLLDINA